MAGGQVIGEYSDEQLGQKVDLASGDVSSSGEDLLPGHIGATILALGDVDPGEHIEGAGVIESALA